MHQPSSDMQTCISSSLDCYLHRQPMALTPCLEKVATTWRRIIFA